MNQHRIIVHPPMGNGKFGCFHAKLMLLYFGGFVRVVIGSANLVSGSCFHRAYFLMKGGGGRVRIYSIFRRK